jgi:WD40 repeat protein
VRLEGHAQDVDALVFEPTGETLVSGSVDGTVRVWRCCDWSLERVIELPQLEWARCLTMRPDGGLLAVGGAERAIRLYNPRTGALVRECLGHGKVVTALAWLPDGSRLVSASEDRTLRLWDPESGEELAILHGHDNYVRSLAVSPDGTRIASGGEDRTVRIWEAEPPAGFSMSPR